MAEDSSAARIGESQDRRQALVAATFARIAETGLEGLRLRDVAAAVGIDHSTLHHYFATKRDLIAAVVEHATGQLRTPATAKGPPSSLADHLRMLGKAVSERPELFKVLREIDLLATRDLEIRAIVQAAEFGWRKALRERLAMAFPTLAARPDATIELIISVAKGVSLSPDTAAAVFEELYRVLERSTGGVAKARIPTGSRVATAVRANRAKGETRS